MRPMIEILYPNYAKAEAYVVDSIKEQLAEVGEKTSRGNLTAS